MIQVSWLSVQRAEKGVLTSPTEALPKFGIDKTHHKGTPATNAKLRGITGRHVVL